MKLFFQNMTRDEVCWCYANDEGNLNDFTYKDWEWVLAYENATSKSDEDLLDWCNRNF